jgi:hypothetical protein
LVEDVVGRRQQLHGLARESLRLVELALGGAHLRPRRPPERLSLDVVLGGERLGLPRQRLGFGEASLCANRLGEQPGNRREQVALAEPREK